MSGGIDQLDNILTQDREYRSLKSLLSGDILILSTVFSTQLKLLRDGLNEFVTTKHAQISNLT